MPPSKDDLLDRAFYMLRQCHEINDHLTASPYNKNALHERNMRQFSR